MIPSVLQGASTTLSPCTSASITLFGPSDKCSRTVEGFLSGNYKDIAPLFFGDCPTRFQNYTTTCRNQINNAEVHACVNVCIHNCIHVYDIRN